MKRILFWARVSLLVLPALLITHLSLLQEAHADNATIAEALFDDGQRLFQAGKYAEACEKFAASQKVDPATGTLLNLALCYEKSGRLATAWTTWRQAASSARAAGQSEREKHARQMAEKLDSQIARLTISVTSSNRPDGLVVSQNGVAQNSAIWGTALPIDAGTYEIIAEAPGYVTWSEQIKLSDGEKKTIDVPELKPDPDAGIAAAVSEEEEEKENTASASTASESTAGKKKSPLMTLGIVLTSAGVVSTGVGTYFGIHALNKNKQSKDECAPNDPNQCSSTGVQLRNSALSSATASTILIGVGAAAIIGGVTLMIVSPKGQTQVGLQSTPGGGRLSFSGTF